MPHHTQWPNTSSIIAQWVQSLELMLLHPFPTVTVYGISTTAKNSLSLSIYPIHPLPSHHGNTTTS